MVLCPGVLDFEPCNLHTVHNAFRKGLNCFGSDAEELTCTCCSSRSICEEMILRIVN